jgi:uncharacterized protein
MVNAFYAQSSQRYQMEWFPVPDNCQPPPENPVEGTNRASEPVNSNAELSYIDSGHNIRQMSLPLQTFFSSPAYAVIGASENREKYGNIVYRYLRAKNFVVFPVNPHLSEVEGDACYPSVSSLPEEVKSVIFVVPPAVTDQVVRECKTRGVTAVWMQPGAESSSAIAFARKHGIAAVYNACIMVLLGPVHSFAGIGAWLKKAESAYSTK